MIGTIEGEVCNRNGCKGIIELMGTESSCSCHINPPCSHCTDAREYCPECDWSAKDEYEESQKSEPLPKKEPYPYLIRKIDDLDKTKIDWISKMHTHFSMIKEGVYPPGMSQEQVRKKVNGTFGGRFEYFNNGHFKFIAYTD